MTNSHRPPASRAGYGMIFILLFIAGVLGYLYVDRDRVARWYAGDIISQEKAPLSERIALLERELAAVEKEALSLRPPVLPDDRVQEVFGAAPAGEVSGEGDPSRVCQDTRERLENLYAYLQGRDYVRERLGADDVRRRTVALVRRLLAAPPVVIRETDSLTRLFENTVHFFRVLGKEDTLLIRDVMRNESDIAEAAFALFYRILESVDSCRGQGIDLPVTLQGSYEYAAYFLHTLGGRSYLLRRTAKIRQLTTYYSVLVLDAANARSLNKHGIDIRPPLDSLIDELQGSTHLVDRAHYLETLEEMRTRYQGLYGS